MLGIACVNLSLHSPTPRSRGAAEARLSRASCQRDETHLPGTGVLRATGNSRHHRPTPGAGGQRSLPIRDTSSTPPTSHRSCILKQGWGLIRAQGGEKMLVSCPSSAPSHPEHASPRQQVLSNHATRWSGFLQRLSCREKKSLFRGEMLK